MQVQIKAAEFFKFYNQNTPETISNSPSLQFKLFCENIAIYSGDKILCKVEQIKVHYEAFESKLILFRHKSIAKTFTKEIILEINGSESQTKSFLQLVQKHNILASHRTPLQLDYSVQNRDSILVSTTDSNLRGFINLFIIYSFINYSRLILDNLMKYRTVFQDSVILTDFYIYLQFTRLSVLFVCFSVLDVLHVDLFNRKKGESIFSNV